MIVSNFSKQKPIPSKVSTKKSAPATTNFSKGLYTYKPNDTMNYDEIFLAQNARFERIGEYKTRRGLAKLNEPIGKTTAINTYTSPYVMAPVANISQTFTVSSSTPLYSINVKASASNAGYGIMQATLYNSSGKIVGKSCVNGVATYVSDYEFVFKDAPSGTLTVKFSTQGPNDRTFNVSTTGGALMYKVNTAPAGKITNIFEANINGTKTLLFTFKEKSSGTTTLYRREANGTVASIRQLPSGVEKVRFAQNINKIRYANGKEGPRIIDPSNSWADTAITTTDLKTGTNLNIKVSNIMDGTQDNMMYFDADTNTQVVWTYPYGFSYNNSPINSYDKFDRDFRQNFPAIETGDPLTAMFNLGGVVYFLTRRNKYYMYSQTADVWTQQASSAQHGTFSQESTISDLNYAYYANDDGIYMFDGSSEASLTQNTIQNTYDAISGKESITLELFENRLYVFYSSLGNGTNDSCLVYNTNLKVWESFDTGLPIAATAARKTASNRFICGSSKFGQLYTYETKTNAYADLGAPIDFDLETSYLHFGTPSQLHRITKWRPEFETTEGDYTVKCGFATDFSEKVKYAYSINLKRQTAVSEDYVWDNPPTYGNIVVPTKLTTIPKVYGQFRRCQLRYQHHAAFEPVSFKSHTVTVQTERIR